MGIKISLTILLCVLIVGKTLAAEKGSGIYINGLEASKTTLATLEANYGIRLKVAGLNDQQKAFIRQVFGKEVDGKHFWYDQISGAWGYEGLPAAGAVMPNLQLGAPLRPDASGGGTNVMVNGRILHPFELNYFVRQFGYVTPGRYFLLPDGSYGFEGGPIMGRLAPARPRSAQSTQSKFGTVLGDDGFVGYMPPAGGVSSSNIGVTCAPDGGCIYN